MSAQRRFFRSASPDQGQPAEGSGGNGFANTILVGSRSGTGRSPLRPASVLLVDYARYHRDRRNIASHFVGIPVIVLALGVLLGRLQLFGANLAWLVCGMCALWYITRGKLSLGIATSAVNAGLIAMAQPLAMTDGWLAWGLGAFAAGWVIQFAGHYYEGRKPAFVDDLVGLLVGPMFVVAEWMMALGLEHETRIEIELGAGSTHLRDLSIPAPH
ncbi:MAG: hypothetical protein RLZZ584_332 [Pseudomonadota bacterium]|jgi:uncharacterized membrane protein YGL010W